MLQVQSVFSFYFLKFSTQLDPGQAFQDKPNHDHLNPWSNHFLEDPAGQGDHKVSPVHHADPKGIQADVADYRDADYGRDDPPNLDGLLVQEEAVDHRPQGRGQGVTDKEAAQVAKNCG